MTQDAEMNIAETWVKAAMERDVDTILSLFSDSITVLPPFQDEPAVGPEEVLGTFGAFVEVTENFEYGRDWTSGNNSVLEFRATIDGKPLHGIDIITQDDEGKITQFEILARPYSAVGALRAAVHKHLGK